MKAISYWNQEHDICFVEVLPHGGTFRQMPFDTLNNIRETFYADPNAEPYDWNIWDGQIHVGFAMANTMQDTDEALMYALCMSIKEFATTFPQSDRYATQEWSFD